MVVAAISLIVFNLGTRHGDAGELREISGVEYAKLHTVASRYSEVADGMAEDLKHERLTLGEYNKIMQRFEAERYRQELRQQQRVLKVAARMSASAYRRLH
ncbi:hypothetical protein [Geomonas limicola]|nr:hypothetical protein [Geomonas limicola]